MNAAPTSSPGSHLNRMLRHTAAGSLALLLAACAGPLQVTVPEKLEPPANETLTAVVAAKGAQIYECRVGKAGGTSHEWVFVAPDAELFNFRGQRIGHHSAGPVWQANDGSKVAGTVKERADAPDSGAIPWLLLSARSVGPLGAFSNVTSIQRVNTVAGLAPATPCSDTNVGATVRSDYTADYRFFASRAGRADKHANAAD